MPFESLVQDMKNSLLKVSPGVIAEGRSNARASEPFLVKPRPRPYHVLYSLYLSMQGVSEENGLLARQKQLDEIILPQSTVKGRYHDMQLLEDGTLIPLTTTEETQKAAGLRKLRPLSEWNLDEFRVPNSPLIAPRGSGSEGDEQKPTFDWLFAGDSSAQALSYEVDKEGNRPPKKEAKEVLLEWPPKGTGDQSRDVEDSLELTDEDDEEEDRA